MRGRAAFTFLTMSSVDAVPVFSTVSNAARAPFSRTMLVCTAKPSRTWATSRTYTVAPFTVLMGRSLRADTTSGLLFTRTRYSRSPTFTVPAGTIKFCRLNAVETSVAESRLA